MIIGNGDLASVLPERNDLLFFASGVSNSGCTDEAEYIRERELLLKQRRGSHLVYFSSIGVLDGNSRYYRHKRDMELMVQANFKTYTIIRIGNIDWGDNPNTLINYLKAHPRAVIRDEYRYIIGKEDFLYWINLIPPWSCEISCVGEKLKVKEIVEKYVRP